MRLERAAVWVAAALVVTWTARLAGIGGPLAVLALPADLSVEAVVAARDAVAPELDGVGALAVLLSALAGTVVVGAWALCKLAWRGLASVAA